MDSIKPIPTWYNGRHYLSRLEARWAVFLGTLKEPFLFEREGFILPPIPPDEYSPFVTTYAADRELWYLPDIWLPRTSQWVELKPQGEPELIEIEKLQRLAYWRHEEAYMVCGEPGFHQAYPSDEMESDANWCQCRYCGVVGMAFHGWATNLKCCKTNQEKERNGLDDQIESAYQVAANYRFDWTKNPDHIFLNRNRRG